jgi:hypothetical protein
MSNPESGEPAFTNILSKNLDNLPLGYLIAIRQQHLYELVKLDARSVEYLQRKEVIAHISKYIRKRLEV